MEPIALEAGGQVRPDGSPKIANCVVPECMDKVNSDTSVDIPKRVKSSLMTTASAARCARKDAVSVPFACIQSQSSISRNIFQIEVRMQREAIAQKCDNCTGYEDKAYFCVSHRRSLSDRWHGPVQFWQQFNVHRRPGFDSVESPQTVPKGWRRFWVIFAILNTLVLSWECLGACFDRI